MLVYYAVLQISAIQIHIYFTYLFTYIFTYFTKLVQREGFCMVHTPILTANDCEGAGEVFAVEVISRIIWF